MSKLDLLNNEMKPFIAWSEDERLEFRSAVDCTGSETYVLNTEGRWMKIMSLGTPAYNGIYRVELPKFLYFRTFNVAPSEVVGFKFKYNCAFVLEYCDSIGNNKWNYDKDVRVLATSNAGGLVITVSHPFRLDRATYGYKVVVIDEKEYNKIEETCTKFIPEEKSPFTIAGLDEELRSVRHDMILLCDRIDSIRTKMKV